MDNLFPVLIFIVIAIASAAQKLQENKQKKDANARRKDRIPSRPESTTRTARSASGVRQARPKGAARGATPAALQPGTTGKELINALFGEGAADSMAEWTKVPPVPVAEKPKQAPVTHRSENPREEALRQREAMQQQYARDNDHSSRGHASGISHQQQSQGQAQPARQRQYTEQERQRIAVERQRRKAQQQQRKRQGQQKSSPQRTPRRAVVAPVASGNFIPRSMPEVRQALVMAEILGPPKAFE